MPSFWSKEVNVNSELKHLVDPAFVSKLTITSVSLQTSNQGKSPPLLLLSKYQNFQ